MTLHPQTPLSEREKMTILIRYVDQDRLEQVMDKAGVVYCTAAMFGVTTLMF